MGERRIYRRKNPVKTVVTALISVVAAIIILFASVFFGFKKYIVYTDDGVRLEVPWLEEMMTEAD